MRHLARTGTRRPGRGSRPERHELADLLDGLGDDQWDRRSLCAGWRVRESRPTYRWASGSPCQRRLANWPGRGGTCTG
ncbi:maleylpyruvate isomerase N-terminal domain-containing protein [Streptomyces sp. NPDC057116]|uniref:maleylpyruvate isomerase N-terminal domain-containing protein n=1 Tax=Streptomyces sp. NPDC057116 TaxID=3346023 RepID=UPI003644E306